MLKPITTEKSTAKLQQGNEYTFVVLRHATKIEIKKDVESTFGVKVQRVRTKIVRGKEKKYGKMRKTVKHQDLKYAVVKLKGKDKIEAFDIKDKK